MTCTNERPTVDGWYWFAGRLWDDTSDLFEHGDYKPANFVIVEVWKRWIHADGEDWTQADGVWCGPLVPPPLPE